jgi:hypothetical protein
MDAIAPVGRSYIYSGHAAIAATGRSYSFAPQLQHAAN